MLALGGLSDLLDGWIARRFHAATWVGGLLDAVADKAFVLAALGTLVAEGWLAWPGALLLVARDLVVLAAAGWAVAARRWDAFRRMPSRRWGRVTTALLFPYFVVAFAWPDLDALRGVLFWASAASSLLAAGDYALRFREARAGSLRA
jgi:phosphatidylglycerophosphate synthase